MYNQKFLVIKIMKSKSNLTYLCHETHYFQKDHSILSITLFGTLQIKNSRIFEHCCEQILKSASKWVILNFRDVTPKIDPEFIPLVHQLFHSIRIRPARILLSGVHPQLKQVFQEKNLAHPEEFTNNLADALNKLPQVDTLLNKI